jgi:hypothetical protein
VGGMLFAVRQLLHRPPEDGAVVDACIAAALSVGAVRPQAPPIDGRLCHLVLVFD